DARLRASPPPQSRRHAERACYLDRDDALGGRGRADKSRRNPRRTTPGAAGAIPRVAGAEGLGLRPGTGLGTSAPATRKRPQRAARGSARSFWPTARTRRVRSLSQTSWTWYDPSDRATTPNVGRAPSGPSSELATMRPPGKARRRASRPR